MMVASDRVVSAAIEGSMSEIGFRYRVIWTPQWADGGNEGKRENTKDHYTINLNWGDRGPIY